MLVTDNEALPLQILRKTNFAFFIFVNGIIFSEDWIKEDTFLIPLEGYVSY